MCKTSVAQTLGTFISENWQSFQRACALIELRCSIYEVPLWEMVIETNKDHEKNRVFLFQKWHTANNSINETSTSHWHCDEIRSILLVFMSRGMQPVPFNHMWKHMQKATIPFGGPAHSQFHFSLFAILVMHDAQTIGLHGYVWNIMKQNVAILLGRFQSLVQSKTKKWTLVKRAMQVSVSICRGSRTVFLEQREQTESGSLSKFAMNWPNY